MNTRFFIDSYNFTNKVDWYKSIWLELPENNFTQCFIKHIALVCFEGSDLIDLTIYSRNQLAKAYVDDVLADIDWNWHRSYADQDHFVFSFRTEGEKLIYSTTQSILDKLKCFNVTHDISRFILQILKELHQDILNGYPKSNVQSIMYRIEDANYPIELILASKDKPGERFLKIISEGNCEKIITALKQGFEPNYIYNNEVNDRGFTITYSDALPLGLAVFNAIYNKQNPERLLRHFNIIKTLVTYGANPSLTSGGFSKSPEEYCIKSVLKEDHKLKEGDRIIIEMLCVLMSAPGSRPCGEVPTKYTNALVGQLITIANRFRVEQHIIQTSMHNIALTLNSKTMPVMHIVTHNNKRIRIERRQANSAKGKEEILTPFELAILFNIYQERFNFAGKEALKQFLECFQGRGELLIDLIYERHLKGIHIAENIGVDRDGLPIIVNGKRIRLYHIMLSLTNEIDCDRLMTLLSFYEAFAMQQKDPDCLYYTVWEAAGLASIRQIAWLENYYPKKDLDPDILNSIVSNLYDQDDLIFDKQWYVKDPLVRSKQQPKGMGFFQKSVKAGKKEFSRASQVVIEDFHEEHIQKVGSSPIIIFRNNHKNLQFFKKATEKRMSDESFDGVVTKRANQLIYCSEPLRRSNF